MNLQTHNSAVFSSLMPILQIRKLEIEKSWGLPKITQIELRLARKGTGSSPGHTAPTRILRVINFLSISSV